jgi:hypothetical protein
VDGKAETHGRFGRATWRTGVAEGNGGQPGPRERPARTWWLIAKNGDAGLEVFAVEHGGGRALPVFGFEEEAAMFLRLGGLAEEGWRVRESAPGELVSMLFGPCSDARSVALDPLPVSAADGTLGPVSVDRKRFLKLLVHRGRAHPGST